MPLAAVVSDDTDLVIQVSHILDARGWATLTVRESTALASIRRERPDLVIFDFRLDRPDVSWTLLDQLRNAVIGPEVPILVVSSQAHLPPGPQERLGSLGARLLPRPFTTQQFIDALDASFAMKPHSPDEGASSGAT